MPGAVGAGAALLWLLAALAGGMVARLLRLPLLVGYLLAGIVVGPHTPGIIAGTATSLVLLVAGVYYFKVTERIFADVM